VIAWSFVVVCVFSEGDWLGWRKQLGGFGRWVVWARFEWRVRGCWKGLLVQGKREICRGDGGAWLSAVGV